MDEIISRRSKKFKLPDKKSVYYEKLKALENLNIGNQVCMRNGKPMRERFYICPKLTKKALPSVTTVMGKQPVDDGLKDWKMQVGEQNARKIFRNSGVVGGIVHEKIEEALINKPVILSGQGIKKQLQFLKPFDVDRMYLIHGLFMGMQRFFDHINQIFAIESKLIDDDLGIGGRCDVIAEYKGVVSVIDWKTKRSKRKKEWIGKEICQAHTYGHMFEKLTGIKTSQVVILCSNYDMTTDEFIDTNRVDNIRLMQEYVEVARKSHPHLFEQSFTNKGLIIDKEKI